jgi:uncharacterized protein
MEDQADVIVVGAGIAGLAAAAELAEAGRRVIILEQEPEGSLGGQAFWSFGGIFLVNSPEQRRLGIRDSHELALRDWLSTAAFDRPEDDWARKWAEAYVAFAAGEKWSWLHGQGVRFFPIVGWLERGGLLATGYGNSVPRFHITWGAGPALLQPFIRRVREAEKRGLVTLRFRHRVNGLTTTGGMNDGVHGDVLAASSAERGVPSSRAVTGHFELRAQAVIAAAGGFGANHEMVRRHWPRHRGEPPQHMLCGVPGHVDGRMLEALQATGGHVVNVDRMWHYPEGIMNHTPIWSNHGIRVASGPSPLWLDANGRRLPSPLFPGFDTLGALEHIVSHGHEHSWFLLNQRIIRREFALSGSEQNPDITNRSISLLLQRLLPRATGPVDVFREKGADFVVRRTLPELVQAMNTLTTEPMIELGELTREIEARDAQLDNSFCKDAQIMAIRATRSYIGDRLVRVAAPHKLLDPEAGPLIAVRLHIVTRKMLGGVRTDLAGRVLQPNGDALPGLYAVGEIAGFGGGGLHGYRALEGTFLGASIFTGRTVGLAVAHAVI